MITNVDSFIDVYKSFNFEYNKYNDDSWLKWYNIHTDLVEYIVFNKQDEKIIKNKIKNTIKEYKLLKEKDKTNTKILWD